MPAHQHDACILLFHCILHSIKCLKEIQASARNINVVIIMLSAYEGQAKKRRHIEGAQKPPQVRSQNMVDSIALRKKLQMLTLLN